MGHARLGHSIHQHMKTPRQELTWWGRLRDFPYWVTVPTGKHESWDLGQTGLQQILSRSAITISLHVSLVWERAKTGQATEPTGTYKGQDKCQLARLCHYIHQQVQGQGTRSVKLDHRTPWNVQDLV